MKFSITIPAYKQKYLYEAIKSCLAQTYKDFELIIVDDASPENLKTVVERFHDKRIKFYRNEKNCGAVDVVDNWNTCLSYAKGDYVICMGDDDCLSDCCLSEYVKLMEKYPKLGVYHAWTEVIDEHSEYLTMQQPRPEWESCLSLLWNRWNGRNRQYIGDFCFKRDLLILNGGFMKLPLAWASDDISAVIAARQGGIANTQVPCFKYRQNRQTITSTGNVDIKMDAILTEKEWYQNFIKEYRQNISDNIPHKFLDIEQKYMKSIESEIDQHFKKKYRMQMQADMRISLCRIFHWMKKKEKYGISSKRVLYAGLTGILSRFHGA